MTSHMPSLDAFNLRAEARDAPASGIVAVFQHARGKAGLIPLWVGEGDLGTPDFIARPAANALTGGETFYTWQQGIPELRAALARYYGRHFGIDSGPNDYIVVGSGMQAIQLALQAVAGAGDECVYLSPAWPNFAAALEIAGGKAVPVTLDFSENGWTLDLERFEAAITPRTRWLFLNSPSNPSGAAYGADQLKPLCEVLLRHPRVWVLADDIYEHILYDGLAFATPAAVEPRLRERTLTINGVSKAYAMTGWRVGYGAGPRALIAAMAVVQSQTTSCPSSVSQAAAIEALTGPQQIVAERRDDFQRRRDFVVAALNRIDGLHCPRPEGAFYTFARCQGLLGRRTRRGALLASDADFCRYLLEDFEVAVVPGSVFGLAPYFRISYATSMAQLEEACARIAAACAALE